MLIQAVKKYDKVKKYALSYIDLIEESDNLPEPNQNIHVIKEWINIGNAYVYNGWTPSILAIANSIVKTIYYQQENDKTWQ